MAIGDALATRRNTGWLVGPDTMVHGMSILESDSGAIA